MTAINPIAGLLVPLQGTLSGELFATRNSPNAGVPLPPAAAVAVQGAAGLPQGLEQGLARLVTLQGGLAPLLADLSAALARPDLPQPVREAAQALLSLRLDGTALGGKSLEGAILNSGLFLEALQASGQPGSGDLKSALLSLRSALQGTLPDTAKAPALATALAPPHRGALPIAQPPAMPSIAMLDGETLGPALLAGTDAALARTTLLQLASLPDDAPQRHGETQHRLVVDIPIATPQGNAVVQLQVERDREREHGGEMRAPSWRIHLAIDIEPLGPVRASVSQIDGRTHVTMFAEREPSARALRDDLPTLQSQLAQAALEPGDLKCRSGIPDREPVSAGLFVDRTS